MTAGWRLVVDGDVCVEGAEIEVTVGTLRAVARMPVAGMAGVGRLLTFKAPAVEEAIRDLAANLMRSGSSVEVVPPGELSRAEAVAAARREGAEAMRERAVEACQAIDDASVTPWLTEYALGMAEAHAADADAIRALDVGGAVSFSTWVAPNGRGVVAVQCCHGGCPARGPISKGYENAVRKAEREGWSVEWSEYGWARCPAHAPTAPATLPPAPHDGTGAPVDGAT